MKLSWLLLTILSALILFAQWTEATDPVNDTIIEAGNSTTNGTAALVRNRRWGIMGLLGMGMDYGMGMGTPRWSWNGCELGSKRFYLNTKPL